MDVSVLWAQSGTFVVRAMAGNNRLGGQDINEIVVANILDHISDEHGHDAVDKVRKNPNDMTLLRHAVEAAKIELSTWLRSSIDVHLISIGRFQYKVRHEPKMHITTLAYNLLR